MKQETKMKYSLVTVYSCGLEGNGYGCLIVEVYYFLLIWLDRKYSSTYAIFVFDKVQTENQP